MKDDNTPTKIPINANKNQLPPFEKKFVNFLKYDNLVFIPNSKK